MVSQPGVWFVGLQSLNYITHRLFIPQKIECCEQFGVNGQRTLYITGVETSCTDDLSAVNGKISGITRIPDDLHQPKGRTLVVYGTEQAIENINPATLGSLQALQILQGSGFLEPLRMYFRKKKAKS